MYLVAIRDPRDATRHPRTTSVVAIALLGTALAPLNSTMIVVALPEILTGLGASLTWGSWIVISYLVAMAAMQPLGGSLGDRYGRRRMLLIGLSGFMLASIAAALASSVEALIIARTAQAIAGAISLPNGTALVRAFVPRELQGRMFGVIGVGIGAAAAIGPPLGGLLTDAFGWRWIFAANLLVVLPALVLVYRLPSGHRSRANGRFDLSGATLLLISMVTLALAATVWRVPGMNWIASAACGLVGVVAVLLFRSHVGRTAAPVLDLTLLSRPGYLAAGLTVLLSNMGMYTILLAVPLFATEVMGWQVRQVGLLLAAMSVPMMLLGPWGGWLGDRFGKRLPAVVGCAMAALGTIPFALIGGAWSTASFLLPLIAVGVGMGLSNAPVHTAALQAARTDQAGQAAGLFSTMRYVGSIVGSAGMAAILGASADVDDFRLMFLLLIVVAVGAVLTAWRLPGGRAAA